MWHLHFEKGMDQYFFFTFSNLNQVLNPLGSSLRLCNGLHRGGESLQFPWTFALSCHWNMLCGCLIHDWLLSQWRKSTIKALHISTKKCCIIIFQEMSYGWFLLKAFLPAVFILADFSFYYLMCSLSVLGSIISGSIFLIYLVAAVKAQTSADWKRGESRSQSGKASYRNLERFLGPRPFWRIIWPFHAIHKTEIRA